MNDIVIQPRKLFVDKGNFSTQLHPLLERLYLMRGICCEQELDHSTQALLNYQHLSGIEHAVDILYLAASNNQKIMIVGDFDTDGATSTALILIALKKMGITNVDYIIPDRFEDGYGLSVDVVKRAIQQKAELIITVDNGISSIEAVEFAKTHELNVIITDHHLAPEHIPNADAIVNPNLDTCHFSSKHLAGVGVTFYFMLAFRAKLRATSWFLDRNIPEYNLANLLDLVALGTVADVVTLDQNNRILVEQGLKRIRSGHCCIGLKALLDITKRPIASLTTNDLGFYIAPRINAAGRMEHMSLGVELLLSEDSDHAKALATILDDLNTERKKIEQDMQKDALLFISEFTRSEPELPSALAIYQPNWHQGIIGILASRLKDKLYRPVIAFAATDDGYLKGSGRSISAIHLRNILESMHLQYPELMVSYGGHAMAAGLTIHEDNFDLFKTYFEQAVNSTIDMTKISHIIETDGAVDNQYFTCQTAQCLKNAGPWGAGFPEPLFDGEFTIHQQKLLTGKHLSLVVEPIQGGPILNGIAFNIDTGQWPNQTIKKIRLVYHLDIDTFRGNQSIKLMIKHLFPSD